jgi:integrase
VLGRDRAVPEDGVDLADRGAAEAEPCRTVRGGDGQTQGSTTSLRPEEQAELRRTDVTLPDEPDEPDELKRRRGMPREPALLRITRASPELTTGRRATGDPKSRAGKRVAVLPAFLTVDVRRHLDWFAAKDTGGLLFVGERGAPFRRSTFGRKWRRARTKVGLPENFRFYDLRHTGSTLVTQSGGRLKDAMVRAGKSSVKAALIYRHSTLERQKEVAAGPAAPVRAERQDVAEVVRRASLTCRAGQRAG